MDPLQRFNDINIRNKIPKSIFSKITKRMQYVEEGVKRIELISGIKYPQYYIEPILPISITSLEVGKYGALFARTIPTTTIQGVTIIVQLSAALIVFGNKGTIHGILAHEFLHYFEFVRRFTKMNNLSDEIVDTIFESQYADAERLYKPNLIFKILLYSVFLVNCLLFVQYLIVSPGLESHFGSLQYGQFFNSSFSWSTFNLLYEHSPK